MAYQKEEEAPPNSAQVDELRRRKRRYESQRGRQCELCGYSGWVLATERGKVYGTIGHAFRCNECDAAFLLNLSQDVPQWDESYHNRFWRLNRYGRTLDECHWGKPVVEQPIEDLSDVPF